mmetsp:Transcript_38189/g.68490  ORF Transcript_38189/g.68490 Transcript_38189/m.68490 type:complete len:246 (+) Transcript_38189:32-769(+)
MVILVAVVDALDEASRPFSWPASRQPQCGPPRVAMLLDGHAAAHGGHSLVVHLSDGNAGGQRVRQPPHHHAPRVHNEGVAVALPLLVVLARLRGRNDVALRLDCAGAEEHLPVRLPRGLGERGGNGHDGGAVLVGQCLVDLGEAKVIADREANASDGRVARHQLPTRLSETALHQQRSVGDVHVKEVHLGVGRHHRSGGINHHVRVQQLVWVGRRPLLKPAQRQPKPRALGQLLVPLDCGAVQRL